jgi:catechol 2,3-dioxygenase-like lactoylglutathione lyase family enzyme
VDDEIQKMDDAASERFPEIVFTAQVEHLSSRETTAKMRVARPTKDIERAVNFWTRVVGFEILSSFEDHDGYDGVIFGYPNAQWELEVTRQSSGQPRPTPTDEDIIVLYVNHDSADTIVERLQCSGHPSVEHSNPYWQAMGASVHVDPDGYRFIVYRTA